ncbi:MAG: hypothetical protein AB1609_11130 [Bacillota bacterium]
MKRFRFRLERILGLRRQTVQLERIRMAEAIGLLRAAEVALEAARRARSAQLVATGELLRRAGEVESVDGAVLARELVLRAELERRTAFWSGRRAQASKAADEQRARVVEAHRGVRALEILRARRRAEYLKEAEREERLILDEAGAVGWVRRHLTGG